MTDKILIETIPVTDERVPIRRVIQPRGELAMIEDGRRFRHLTYFTLKKGGGFFRGGHYHLEKLEYLYLAEGRLKITFIDLESGESSHLEVPAGTRITIRPRCAHRLEAIEEARVIEYFDSIHDPDDDHRYEPLE
jgi:dTDP-4-dehydrorhamnose 3,5-epimerase-like enzyme